MLAGDHDDTGARKTKKKQHADTKAFSLAKMAAYVSKYLTKHHAEGLEGRRMWDSTQSLTPPKAITLEFPEGPLADIISAAFECPPGHRRLVTGSIALVIVGYWTPSQYRSSGRYFCCCGCWAALAPW